MKTKLLFILFFVCKISFSQDLVSDGSNKWILHTPDDGRTTMFVAPWVNNDWAWWLSTQFLNNGDVHFSGTITTPAKLGIGINPTASLHVSTPTGDLLVENSGIEGAYVTVHSGRFNRPAVTIYKQAGTEFWHTGILYDEAGNQKYSIGTNGSFSSSKLTIQADGNVGIGVMTPQQKLDVDGFARMHGTELFEDNTLLGYFSRGGSTTHGWDNIPTALTISYYQRDFAIGGWAKDGSGWKGASLFINSNTGNVLIGKTTQNDGVNYKLDVAGSIRANEIKVNTTGADFVFEPTYKLRSLAEVESFIKKHKHLPDVAPAADMQVDGVSVSELQTKLLQKIEELTLYSIEQDKAKAKLEVKVEDQAKKNLELEQKFEDQAKQNAELKQEVEALKQLITQKLK